MISPVTVEQTARLVSPESNRGRSAPMHDCTAFAEIVLAVSRDPRAARAETKEKSVQDATKMVELPEATEAPTDLDVTQMLPDPLLTQFAGGPTDRHTGRSTLDLHFSMSASAAGRSQADIVSQAVVRASSETRSAFVAIRAASTARGAPGENGQSSVGHVTGPAVHLESCAVALRTHSEPEPGLNASPTTVPQYDSFEAMPMARRQQWLPPVELTGVRLETHMAPVGLSGSAALQILPVAHARHLVCALPPATSQMVDHHPDVVPVVIAGSEAPLAHGALHLSRARTNAHAKPEPAIGASVHWGIAAFDDGDLASPILGAGATGERPLEHPRDHAAGEIPLSARQEVDEVADTRAGMTTNAVWQISQAVIGLSNDQAADGPPINQTNAANATLPADTAMTEASVVKSLVLNLRPAELGHVEVRITARFGTMRVRLTFEQEQSATLIRSSTSELAEHLARSGLNLDGLVVDQATTAIAQSVTAQLPTVQPASGDTGGAWGGHQPEPRERREPPRNAGSIVSPGDSDEIQTHIPVGGRGVFV